MSEVDIKKLFDAGAHFGHKTSRWNPKMADYIHSKRQESHIINLEKTVEGLENALPFITKVVASGKQVLFVGTKRQAKDIVRAAAESVKQPYVVERWLGGMLTNASTINSQIKKLKMNERKMDSGELARRYNKLEVQRIQEEINADNIKYGGIKELNGKPGALFVTDVITDLNAVKEANKLGIPVVAMVDTNADPSLVDYVIPCNDDAIGAIQVVTDYVVEAVKAGTASASKVAADKTAPKKVFGGAGANKEAAGDQPAETARK